MIRIIIIYVYIHFSPANEVLMEIIRGRNLCLRFRQSSDYWYFSFLLVFISSSYSQKSESWRLKLCCSSWQEIDKLEDSRLILSLMPWPWPRRVKNSQTYFIMRCAGLLLIIIAVFPLGDDGITILLSPFLLEDDFCCFSSWGFTPLVFLKCSWNHVSPIISDYQKVFLVFHSLSMNLCVCHHDDDHLERNYTLCER